MKHVTDIIPEGLVRGDVQKLREQLHARIDEMFDSVEYAEDVAVDQVHIMVANDIEHGGDQLTINGRRLMVTVNHKNPRTA